MRFSSGILVFALCEVVLVKSQVFFDDDAEHTPSRSIDRNNNNVLVITISQPSQQSGFRRPTQQQQSFQNNQNHNGVQQPHSTGFQQNFHGQQQNFQSSNNPNRQSFGRPREDVDNNFQNQPGFDRPSNPNNFQQQGQGFGRPTNQNNFGNPSSFPHTHQVVTASPTDCRTYQDAGGYCTPLTSCEKISNILQNRSPFVAARILRRSICGFSGLVPSVCCPTGRNQQHHQVPQEQTHTTSVPTSGNNGNHNLGIKNDGFNHKNDDKRPADAGGQEGLIIIPPPPTSTTTKAPFTTTTTKKPFADSPGLIIGNGPVALLTPQRNASSPVVSPSGFSDVGLPNDCGVSTGGKTRIVGGLPAQKGAWPWIAALGYKEQSGNVNYLCGGALISPNYVITASHCLHGRNDLASVRLGDLDLFTDEDGATPVEVEVDKIILHPNYDPSTFKNDVALLRLKQPVKFTELIHPICLPNTVQLRSQRFENGAPFVIGWGSIQFNGPSSSVLRQVQVPTVPESECQQKYSSFKSAVVDGTNICAGHLAGGKDACQGDSGGPLQQLVGNQNKFVLIGVVSFGFKCAEPGFPGVYTRITSHLDWIENEIKK